MRKVKESSWIKYIKQRIEKNKNFLCIISGPTGSGKSWSALSICEQLDDDFDINRVVFKGKDLMRLVNYGDLPKGAVILWDETQIDLSNRNWQSLTNKLLNYLLSTFRHKCFVLIFTAPYADFLDSATLKLFHANFETLSINRTSETVLLKPKMLQYNATMKKWYRKYLKLVRFSGGMAKIKRWRVKKPSDELIEGYEAKKVLFTSQLNKDIETKLEQIDSMGEVKKPLTELQTKVVECWKRGIIVQKKIAEKSGIDYRHVSRIVASLYKKGYRIEQYSTKIHTDTLKKPMSNLNFSLHKTSIDKSKVITDAK